MFGVGRGRGEAEFEIEVGEKSVGQKSYDQRGSEACSSGAVHPWTANGQGVELRSDCARGGMGGRGAAGGAHLARDSGIALASGGGGGWRD